MITWCRRLRWLRHGLAEHIPPCCVARFVLTRGSERQAMERGRAFNAHGCYVPCLILHRWADSPELIHMEVSGNVA